MIKTLPNNGSYRIKRRWSLLWAVRCIDLPRNQVLKFSRYYSVQRFILGLDCWTDCLLGNSSADFATIEGAKDFIEKAEGLYVGNHYTMSREHFHSAETE